MGKLFVYNIIMLKLRIQSVFVVAHFVIIVRRDLIFVCAFLC